MSNPRDLGCPCRIGSTGGVWTGCYDTVQEAVDAWNSLSQPKNTIMTQEKLNKIVKLLTSQKEKGRKLYALGVDDSLLTDELHEVIDILLECQFKDKNETLSWYIYEDPDPPVIYERIHDDKENLIANKKDKVLYDFRKKGDLWRYLND